jgi:putative hydrolase of the HAD superfamily
MKFLVFDMYGVIIEESKGKFTPFVYSHFRDLNKTYFRELYIKASTGVIDSDNFIATLGFTDPQASKCDYIEKHLTLDKGFIPFAEKFSGKYQFALLSNDVKAWSEHIRSFHNIDRYFTHIVISADAGCRKPGREIFEIALTKMQTAAKNCIFIDNSVQNLVTASEVGMDTILFNRDGEEYDGKIVNSFEELAIVLSEVI